jgi:RNA polymerase primary sigma factor
VTTALAPHAHMTPEEEAEHIARAQEGDQDALLAIIRSQQGALRKEARSLLRPGVDLDDLMQEGNLALMRAVYGFDPAQGARLWTYARRSVREAMGEHSAAMAGGASAPARTVKRYEAAMRAAGGDTEAARAYASSPERGRGRLEPSTFDAVRASFTGRVPEEETLDVPESMDPATSAVDRATIRAILASLKPRHRAVLALSFGLGSGPMTDEEVGEALGLSRPRVVTIRKEALEAARKHRASIGAEVAP